jgi:hypothetical protein
VVLVYGCSTAFGGLAKVKYCTCCEVASIRLADPGASQDGYSLMTNRGAGLVVKNGTVKTLLAFACGVRELQLSGGPG